MTPEERQAEALARWLDGPRDAPPPDLDPEIVEVVTSLQTDRIPAPRVTAEEILASVTAGPLAAGGAPATVPEGRGSGAADGAASLDLADAAIPAPANRPGGPARRPWIPMVFGGGAAVALAAALALIAILPRFVADEAPQDLAQPSSVTERAAEGLALREVAAEETQAERPAAAYAPAASGSSGATKDRRAEIARAAPATSAAPPPPAAAPGAGAGGLGSVEGATGRPDERALGRASAEPAGEPAVADLDEESEPILAEEVDELLDAPAELDALDRGYSSSDDAVQAKEANTATRSSYDAVASEERDRAPRQRASRGAAAPEPERTEASAPVAATSTDPAPDLAIAAGPPGPLSAVALPIQRRLDEGDARGAVDAATTALARRDLDRPSRADLHYVRGLAWRALGRTADADADFRDAARLR